MNAGTRPERTLIVYGNCQAEAIGVVLERIPRIRDRFRIAYVRSFSHPVEGFGSAPTEVLEACKILFEQNDVRPLPDSALLPADCIKLKFPSLDLNVLWPFNRVNPYNDPETVEHPYGRFPYGDGVIVRCLEQGMSAEETLAYYLTRWDEYSPDLDRLYALDRGRLEARDRHCDVKVGGIVMDTFQNERLFWSVNHPTTRLLAELIARLLAAAEDDGAAPSVECVDAVMRANFGERGPLGIIAVPVHPKVAEHFRLVWYDPNEVYPAFDGKSYDYVQYFKAMIDAAAQRQALLQSA